MANSGSAAGSSDLQKNKSNSSKRKVTFTNDAMKGRNEGSSSGKEMLNMGLQTGTNIGNIEVGQSPATKKPRPDRRVADQKHYYKNKAELKLLPVWKESVEKLEAKCQELREESSRNMEAWKNDAKWLVEYGSQINLLKWQNIELSNQVNSLIAILDSLIAILPKNTPTIQPELGSMSQHYPVASMNQQPFVDMNQPFVDMNQQQFVDMNQYIYFNQFSNPSGPPQPMQTGGGESEMHNTGNN